MTTAKQALEDFDWLQRLNNADAIGPADILDFWHEFKGVHRKALRILAALESGVWLSPNILPEDASEDFLREVMFGLSATCIDVCGYRACV